MTPMPSTDQLIEDLAGRFDRVERAILGDESVGHLGLVHRVGLIEADHEQIPVRHGELEQKRVDGDRRVHGRLDDHESATGDRLDSIEKKIDRTIWISAGAFVGGLGVGSFADLGKLLGGG